MKKQVLMVVAALLLVAVMASSAAAQTVTYAVGVQIKNLESTPAENVTITYYNQDGTAEPAFTVPTIPANRSYTMATLQGVGQGFNGSAVINSTNRLAAIANVFGNGTMGASYTAFSSGDTIASLPLIMRNHYGFNTWFNVQNVGSAPTTVTVAYSDVAQTEAKTIQPGASATFNQAGNTNLPDPAGNAGYVGSATVTSSDGVPIVATLLEQGPTTLLGYDSFKNADTSLNPVMPLVNTNNYDYQTGIQVQNTGNTATTVTISYYASQAGADCAETQVVPANDSATFAIGAFSGDVAGETCANGTAFVGSAKVTGNSASQPLVVIVNQLNNDDNKGASYNGFNPANGTATVELPLIMDRNYGYSTGFAIANVGSQATTITCTYTDNSHTDTATVQPNEALTVQNGDKLANGYVGSATCTATGGDAKIVGMVNEVGYGYDTDTFLVYEGTNR